MKTSAAKRRGWGGRLARGSLILVGVGLLAVGGLLWVLTRSWYIAGRIEPVLSELLGGSVEIGSARYEGDGRFRLDDLVLRVRTLTGEAGEIATFGQTRVIVDMDELRRGEVVVLDVTVSDARIRLSESLTTPGHFNYMDLEPALILPDSNLLPPQVRVDRAAIEYGVHRNGGWERYGRRVFSGSLHPVADSELLFSVGLSEVDDSGDVVLEGVGLNGTWDLAQRRQHVELTGLAFDERTFAMCPELVRSWWRKMNLVGSIDRLVVDVALASNVIDISIELGEVALTLPIWSPDIWARYSEGEITSSNQRPRMNVSGGTIEFGTDRVALRHLKGALVSTGMDDGAVGVPYTISFEITDLPAMAWDQRSDWMESVLSTAPFTMDLAIETLDVRPDDNAMPAVIELPAAAARVLDRFRLEEWTLSTNIHVTRDSNGQLTTLGSATIADGTGVFRKFPYPLKAINAHLQFDHEQVTVTRLTGRGDTGAALTLTGTIAPPSKVGRIDMELIARNVPIDDNLRQALTEPQRAIFDSIHDVRSAERLAAAGAFDGLSADFVAFHPGGLVDLELQIDRELGPAHPTRTTGIIDVREARILLERFPYPLHIAEGRLRWANDGIYIVPRHADGPGLPVTVAGGGTGDLSGHLAIVGPQKQIVPALTLTINDDTVSDLLFGALPPTAAEMESDPALADLWPGQARSEAARRLAMSGMTGKLEYQMVIGAMKDGVPQYVIDVGFQNAEMDFSPLLAEMIGDGASPRSELWTVTDGSGALRLTNTTITLQRCSGVTGIGRIDVTGQSSPGDQPGPEVMLHVSLAGAGIGPYMLDLLPAKQREQADTLWARYRPSGQFDAEFTWHKGGSDPQPPRLLLRPNRLEVEIDGNPVVLRRKRGSITIGANRLNFDDIEFVLTDASGGGGRVELRAELGANADPGFLEGTWLAGTFGSPAVIDLLRWFAAPEQANRVAELHPMGEFDASFTFTPPRDDTPRDFSLTLQPREFGVVLRDTPVQVTMKPGAQVEFRPGSIQLVNMRGEGDDFDFDVSGPIRVTDGAIHAALNLSLHGRLLDQEIAVFLPEGVRKVLEGITLLEGNPSRLVTRRFVLDRGAAPDDGPPEPWSIEFLADMDLSAASFNAGVLFSEIEGRFEVEVLRVFDSVPIVTVKAHPEHMVILGQQLRNVEAVLTLRSDGNAVRLEEFCAEAGDGLVAATAEVGIGDDLSYSVHTRLIHVPLQDFRVEPKEEAEEDVEEDVGEEAEEPRDRPQLSGDLYAEIALAGERRNTNSRVGRGFARIADGQLGQIPLLVQLVQLLQLSAPASQIDYGEVDFFVAGDTVYFERVRFESTVGGAVTHAIEGKGTIDLETMELDGRVRTRSGIAGLREVLGAIGDHLAAINVRGQLWSPEFDVDALPGLSGRQWPRIVAPPLDLTVKRDEDEPARTTDAGEEESP